MIERSFDEMIGYFNRRVSEMDIDREYKIELLGMVTALGYKHEKTEPQWIPCSERLPDTEDCPMDCLVTRKSKFIGNYTDMAVCEKNGTWTHEDWDAIVLGDVENGKATGLVSTRDDNIIAWMPLPEPWKGGEG